MYLRSSLLLLSILSVLPVAAETVSIQADRDATLIEDPDGALANGAGPSLFVGRTGQSQNAIRRALLHFDVAAAVPRQAIVEDVALTLFMNPSNSEPGVIRLHRVQADWGEGPSSSAGGSGAPAQLTDATWLHTFWDADSWVRSGGQFVGRASAELEVGGSGFHTWEASQQLAQDVNLWTSADGRNFGWILVGDETTPQTSKGFASREAPNPASRPVLTIRYRLPAGGPGH